MEGFFEIFSCSTHSNLTPSIDLTLLSTSTSGLILSLSLESEGDPCEP